MAGIPRRSLRDTREHGVSADARRISRLESPRSTRSGEACWTTPVLSDSVASPRPRGRLDKWEAHALTRAGSANEARPSLHDRRHESDTHLGCRLETTTALHASGRRTRGHMRCIYAAGNGAHGIHRSLWRPRLLCDLPDASPAAHCLCSSDFPCGPRVPTGPMPAPATWAGSCIGARVCWLGFWILKLGRDWLCRPFMRRR